MKVNEVVKRETKNIAIGIIICSVITQIGFLILGKYSLAVLFGSIYGGAIALLNFFLMGLTVQKIADMDDQNAAKRKMQASYSTRQLLLLLLVGIGMYISINYEIFHWLPILIAIVYPRIIIAFGGIFRKEWRTKRGDAE
ncbi:MAG: hypothetical protein GX359_03975 [Clostridiales bacterium]|nr:hypothetical protein [Clostridiales bacterium]